MSQIRTAWLVLVLVFLGATAAVAPITQTSGSLSDSARFADNELETTADWDRIEGSASAPMLATVDGNATLTVSFENVGEGPDTAEYEVVVGNESVDDGSRRLAADEVQTNRYKLDTNESGEIDWYVTIDGETTSGTVTIGEGGKRRPNEERANDRTDEGSDRSNPVG